MLVDVELVQVVITRGWFLLVSIGPDLPAGNARPHSYPMRCRTAQQAFESASDALRREVAPQGIQVVIIQSGGVKTPMAAKSGPLSLKLAQGMSKEHTRLYGALISSTVSFQSSFLQRAMTADQAAKKITKIVTTKRPRTRYGLGLDAAFTLPMARFLPARLMDRSSPDSSGGRRSMPPKQ